MSRQPNINSKWRLFRQNNLNIYSIKLIKPINYTIYILDNQFN